MLGAFGTDMFDALACLWNGGSRSLHVIAPTRIAGAENIGIILDETPIRSALVSYADRVIVTSDNPRSEDPDAIIEEVLAGAGPGAEHNVDRRAAIAEAIAGARRGDVVVIAGKGHEQGQEFEAGRKVPFDDVTVAQEALRSATLAR